MTDPFQPGTLCETVLNLDEKEKQRLSRLENAGVMALRPVALPEGDHLVGGCRHLSHPVAAKSGDALVVLYKRNTAHGNRLGKNDSCLMSVITRSTDAGKTWSPPIDLRAPESEGDSPLRCHMAAIGSDAGGVVVVCREGVFRSEDGGETWRRLAGQVDGDTPVPLLNSGGRICSHPDRGLVFTAHNVTGTTKRKVDRERGEYNIVETPPELWVCSSTDKGESWQVEKVDLPAHGANAEPAPVFWKDHLIVIGRGHSDAAYDPETRTWRYVQLVRPPGARDFRVQFTTMRASDAHHISGRAIGGSHCQDTVAVDYNPVSKRLEAVVTNRDGGGEGAYDDQSCHTLNLYSMDPDALIAGSAEWQFESTLLRRQGIIHGGAEKERPDGMHPAGAVMDVEACRHYIHIYCGYRYAPAGVFQLARSLRAQTPGLQREEAKT